MNTPSDTLGNTWSLAKSLTSLGSSITFALYVYMANEAKTSAADTVTLSFTGTVTDSYLTCWEAASVSNSVRASQTGSGTYTSGTSTTLSATSLSYTSGDLVYAFGGYQPCTASGAPSYTSSFTSMSAYGTDFAGATVCHTSGSKKYDVNTMDEYLLPSSSSSTTASIGSGTWSSSVTTGTWGWGEIILDFTAAIQNLSVTESLAQSQSLAVKAKISVSPSISQSQTESIKAQITAKQSLSQSEVVTFSERITVKPTELETQSQSFALKEILSIKPQITESQAFNVSPKLVLKPTVIFSQSESFSAKQAITVKPSFAEAQVLSVIQALTTNLAFSESQALRIKQGITVKPAFAESEVLSLIQQISTSLGFSQSESLSVSAVTSTTTTTSASAGSGGSVLYEHPENITLPLETYPGSLRYSVNTIAGLPFSIPTLPVRGTESVDITIIYSTAKGGNPMIHYWLTSDTSATKLYEARVQEGERHSTYTIDLPIEAPGSYVVWMESTVDGTTSPQGSQSFTVTSQMFYGSIIESWAFLVFVTFTIILMRSHTIRRLIEELT